MFGQTKQTLQNEHLRLQKGQRKMYRKPPFHSQKDLFFFQPPPLHDYPEEQFTELWIAMLKGSFGDKCRLALNLNS